MKTTNQLKAGAILSYINLGIGMIIPLFYTPIMLKLLGQAEYGLYGLSNSVCSYLSLLTLGLGGAIVRYLMKYRTAGDTVMLERTAGLFLIFYSIIALVSVITGFGITFFTGTMFAQGLSSFEIHRLNILIVLMSINSAISLVGGVYSSISICFERYFFQRTVQIIGTILLPVCNLVALYAGYASIGMAIMSVLLQAVTLYVNIWYCTHILNIHPKIKHPPVELIHEIFGFSVFVFIGMIADLLYWATDKVLIGAMIGSVAVAVYNVGSTFNNMLQSMSAAISSVFAPRVNALVFSNCSTTELSELLIRVGRIQYLIVSLVLSGFIAFGRPFIFFWAGSEYMDAYTVSLLTMIPLTIPLIQNIAYTTIVAQNRHHFRSILYTVLAVLNAVSTFILIPYMGIIGAALCTCIVFVIGHGLCMNWFYYKKIGFDIPGFWFNILKMSFVPGVMLLLCWILQRAGFVCSDLKIFFAAVIGYTIVFCGLSWCFTMNPYEKDLICSLLKKFLPKKDRIS